MYVLYDTRTVRPVERYEYARDGAGTDTEIVAHRTNQLIRACDPDCYQVFLSVNGGVRMAQAGNHTSRRRCRVAGSGYDKRLGPAGATGVAPVSENGWMVTPALRFGYLIPIAAASGWVALAMTVFQGQAFAWPARSPLSAATIGSAYLAGGAALAVASELRCWVEVRAVVICSLVLFGLLLGVMWLHREQLAAGWLFGHAIALLAGLVLLVAQRRTGRAGTRPRPGWVPWWTAAPVASLALMGTVLGLAALLVPLRMSQFWPWDVAILDLRMMGAWILAFGVGGWLCLAEAAPARRRAGAAGCVVAAIAAMLALVMYAGEVHWDKLPARIYIGAAFALAIEGAIAWVLAGRFTRS